MTAISKASAKAYFETGDKPTQAQFADLIDSYQDAASNLGVLSSAGLGTVGLRILSATTSASARSVTGATVVGDAVFIAATTAAAQQALGGGTVGRLVFEAVTTAAAQAIIGKPFSGCLLTKSIDQSIPNNALTTVTWANELYDTGTFFTVGTSPANIVIPAAANNKYAVFTVGASWTAGTTGFRYAVITKNSAGFTPSFQNAVAPVTGTDTVHNLVTAPFIVSAGDTYQLMVQQTIGSAHPLQAAGSYLSIEILD